MTPCRHGTELTACPSCLTAKVGRLGRLLEREREEAAAAVREAAVLRATVAELTTALYPFCAPELIEPPRNENGDVIPGAPVFASGACWLTLENFEYARDSLGRALNPGTDPQKGD